MTLLRLERVACQPAGHTLFQDLDWSLDEGSKIGLVGPNGAGKSSLLRVIAGDLAPDAGSVHPRRGARLARLPQEVHFEQGRSVLDVVLLPPPQLEEVDAELASLQSSLEAPELSRDPDRLARLLERQADALRRFEALGGYVFEGRVRAHLSQLGVGPELWENEAQALSGGQKKLVALARLFAAEPDLLLLDEPDNHLDLGAKGRLEEALRRYGKTLILISHDRYLLDGCVEEIAELEGGRLTHYAGNYSTFATFRELRRLQQQKSYHDQQKEIRRIEASIRRFEHWARLVVNERHIKQARSRRRRLERMEERGEIIERVVDTRPIEVAFSSERGSQRALVVEGVSMGFGSEPLFAEVGFELRHGERLGLVGANGVGKSVLLGLIRGERSPLEGVIRVGPSTRIGHYSQEHESLEAWRVRTPLERVRDLQPMDEGAAVARLLRMGFRYEQARQEIGTLSGGERSRLQLLCLMLQRPSLLLLDEPTHHLDLPSAEALEHALDDYEGALLVVSHDRYFLDKVVDRVAVLRNGFLETFDGGYTDLPGAAR
jgi:ATP-binding cassette subfamily F protein 3